MTRSASLLAHYLLARAHRMRWRNREALERWQEERIRRHLHRVALKSPHFARLANHFGVAAWRQWPVADKGTMMRHFQEWNTAGVSLEEAWALASAAERTRDFSGTLGGISVGLSTGTSGSRGVFLASEAERSLWAAILLARVLRGTLGRRHRAALFLRADNPLYHTVGSRRLRFEFFDLLTPIDEHWPRLARFRPTILAAPPVVLTELAARPGAMELMDPPAILLSVADVLAPRDRERIEGGFGQRVDQIYQATEGFLAATCSHGRLHWNEDVVAVEKEWIDGGEGRYIPIITDFRRETQPIIRYRLDDVIVADPSQGCSCGSVFDTLAAIEGRCDDVLRLPRLEGAGEVSVFPDFVRRAMVMALPDDADFTVRQLAKDRWTIRLSRDCPLEPIRREIADLAVRIGARPPGIDLEDWKPAPLHEKRRRVRCELGPEPSA